MSTSIGALNISMSANTSSLQSDFSRAAEIARRGGSDIKASMLDAANAAEHGFKSVADSMGLLESPISKALEGFGAVGLALGAVAGGGFVFKELVGGAIEMGESMANLSIKTGLSVESISKFTLIASLAGTQMDTVAGLMKKLEISASQAANGNKNLAAVYTALGISVQELKTLAPDELMTRVAKSIQGLDPNTVQDVMKSIGGKGGADALVFLRELNERFDDTHSKISTQFAADAKEFGDNIKIMTENTKYLGVEFASHLVPSINIAIEAFNEARKAGDGFFTSLYNAANLKLSLSGVDFTHVGDEITSAQAKIDKLKADDASASSNPGVVRLGGNNSELIKTLEDRLTILKDYQKKNAAALANPVDADKNNDVNAALGLKNNSAGNNFLAALKAQSTQVESNKIAMLELQASEKGVADQAAPLIAKIKELDESRGVDAYAKNLEIQNSDLGFQQQLIGKNVQEVEILNIEHKNTVDLEKQKAQLTKEYGDLSEKTLQRMTDLTQSATRQQIDAVRQRQAAETSWSAGASKSIADYSYAANNAATGASTAFSNGFKNMEDAVVNFAMTGKLNFSNFATSVISDLIRIQARAAISGIATSLGQAIGLGGYGSATEGSSNFIGPSSALANKSANGNIFSGGNVIPFANGGVVSTPTLFPMANGGTGLMGEAGTEAVMPLTRDGSGKLGVKSLGAQTPGNVINITVNNEAGGDGYTAVATAKKNDSGIDVEVLVKKAMATDLRNNGAMSQQMASVFGLRRAM